MTLWNDFRVALRLLARDRALTVAAVLALALGIAANNTVFTLVNGALLRDLPFDAPDRIVLVGTRNTANTRNPNSGMSYLDLQDWRAASRTFDDLGASNQTTMNVVDERGPAERFIGSYISGHAFSMIGHSPILGRNFQPSDDRRGAEPVVMLGYSVWRNRYQSDRGIIGRSIRVNGIPSTVIGVMPEDFGFPQRSAVWQTLALLPAASVDRRDVRSLIGFGRLAEGVTIDQARADLGGIATTLARQYPDSNKSIEPRVQPYRDVSIGQPVRVVLLTLMGAVAFVLLIACANVANLLLARVATRSREVSLRMSLGASRWRIVRQLLVESLVLAAIAGGLGFGLSLLGVEVFWNSVADSGPPYWLQFSMDARVFAFFAVVCLGTAVLFGLLPALQTSRTNIAEVLNEGGRGNAGALRNRRWTGALVTIQLALTITLLTGAGLMMRNFIAQYQLDAGIDTSGLVRMRLDLTESKYPSPDERAAFYRRLEERLSSATGLRAAIASAAPRGGGAPREVSIEGNENVDPNARPLATSVSIGTRYFEAIGARPVRGRSFNAADNAEGAPTALVNERFALMYFPDGNAIGKRIRLEASPNAPASGWLTIVGVAQNVRQRTPEGGDFDPIVYTPYAANPLPFAMVVVRSNLNAAVLAQQLRSHVMAVDADIPVFDVMTIDESLAANLWPQRVFGSMFGVFAVIALILATVGLYAVTAYSVAQRTREIGVRVALGAQAKQVWWLVTRRASVQLTIGLVVGMAGAAAIGRLLRGLLIGAGGTDALTLLLVAVLLVLVACAACLIPARRAMRIDPIVALRNE